MLLINPGRSPSSLMQQMRTSVEERGELVRLTIGNSHVDMHYEAALQIAGWLRLRAKQAKKNAGDMSRQWRVLAQLDGISS